MRGTGLVGLGANDLDQLGLNHGWEIVLSQVARGTGLVGFGANDLDQLGLNHGWEIDGWLRGLCREEKLGGLTSEETEALLAAVRLRVSCWSSLEKLSTSQIRKCIDAAGFASANTLLGASATSSCLPALSAAIANLSAEFAANKKSERSPLRWTFSGRDHLLPAAVPQGIYFGLDGKVFENLGGDLPGVPCTCAEFSGVATSELKCEAHGVPLTFDFSLPLDLPSFPPRSVDIINEDGIAVRIPVAAHGDTVRVGVYPKDGGLRAGNAPKMEVALRDHNDGPQHGSNFVERQMHALDAAFQDPLATATRSLHYDGSRKFPEFHSGRQLISRVQCGCEYTVVVLASGELRLLGDAASAMARLQKRQPRTVFHPTIQYETHQVQPFVTSTVTAAHLGILGTTETRTYSKPVEREALLVRPTRGSQRPRALSRITPAQLLRLAFPHHTD
ncbi:hypothetical protein T484DRAFT_1885461 [Baffinella frigidus]|nr:hypothetical protein T484DRAFT_1885461 [Cryptophyta sp. CCMP2293]